MAGVFDFELHDADSVQDDSDDDTIEVEEVCNLLNYPNKKFCKVFSCQFTYEFLIKIINSFLKEIPSNSSLLG